MKVKMKEHYQQVGLVARHVEGFDVNMLEKGEMYIVPQLVGAELLAAGKAEEVKSEAMPKMKAMEPPAEQMEQDEPFVSAKKRGRK